MKIDTATSSHFVSNGCVANSQFSSLPSGLRYQFHDFLPRKSGGPMSASTDHVFVARKGIDDGFLHTLHHGSVERVHMPPRYEGQAIEVLFPWKERVER